MLHWWECSSRFGFPEFPQKFEEYREYCVVNGYGHFENLKKKNRPPFILKNPITSRLTGMPGTSRQQFLTTVYSVVSSAVVFWDVMQCSPPGDVPKRGCGGDNVQCGCLCLRRILHVDFSVTCGRKFVVGSPSWVIHQGIIPPADLSCCDFVSIT